METINFGTNGDMHGGLPRESHVQEYVSIILRGKWIILASMLLATTISAFVTLRTDPVYESAALVLVDMKGKGGQLPFFDFAGTSFNKMTNELEILKSRTMAEAVAQDLLKDAEHASPISEVTPILLVIVDGVPQQKLASVREVAGRLLGSVLFVPIRDSDIIRITARSNHRAEAALLANTYMKVYAERNMDASRTRSRAVREFLQGQLETRRTALDTAEASLQAYMKSAGMVSLDGESNKVVAQLSQLEANRDAIEVEIRSKEKALASYREEIAKQEPSVARTLGESSDAYIRLLQDKLAALEVQRDVVIAQNPALAGQSIYSEKLKEIDSQIAALKVNLKSRTEAFLKTIGSGEDGIGSAAFVGQMRQKIVEQQIELEALDARKRALQSVIAQYERQFNQIPEKSIELAKLQRARLSNEKLYLLVEEKYNEAAITEKSEFGYVDIIDPAIVPGGPVSPNMRKNLILGLLVGLGLGVAYVLLRSYLDVRVRTPEDLKRFGFIPLSAVHQMDNMHKQEASTGNGHSPHESPDFDPHLVAYHNPLSPLAEAYRRLRTNVLYAQLDTPLKSFLVTSANPSEGKSTTISNLAVAFAQAEKRVLLVDADMRRATIHNYFRINKNPGLTDIFVGSVSIDDALNRNVVENLDVLCCGTTPPNPAELLGSRRMREFIEQMSGKYDILMFDSPPLLAVTDAAVLSTIVDGAILVASAGKTRATAIYRATESLTNVGGKVLGVLLNNFDVKKAYGGYYGSYGYSYYAHNYGYYHSNGNGESPKKKRKKTVGS
ncbi:MAG: polysaccharide biosynthesis tyrosine autokinase [Bacteroidetes bacterium]|nr:polysaccharide biosynthesis tyrosine autokinase [Bacteroidota bacterium]